MKETETPLDGAALTAALRAFADEIDAYEAARLAESIAAAIRVYQAALWRPIAKHDGSAEPVLIGCARTGSMRWAVWSGGFWRDGQVEAGGMIPGCPAPTHFCPLPAAPAAS